MKCLFLSPFLGHRMGGIHEIMRNLANEIPKFGFSVEAVALSDTKWNMAGQGWDNIKKTYFNKIGPEFFGFSPDLKRAVLKSDADILHLHALWMYTSVITLDWKRMTKRPYLVTPNGMLEPWALSNGAWKKKFARFLYEKRMLGGAACLQANTEKEMRDFHAYGLRNPVAVIPNGVELPEDPACGMHGNHALTIAMCDPGATEREFQTPRTLLFLGRIHPKKGLRNAIRAFAKSRMSKLKDRGTDEWRFVIAGWDQEGHRGDLAQLCKELGLRWEVEGQGSKVAGRCPEVLFCGPRFGEEKKALFQSSSAFILPSLSEGLPMSVLEAWSYGLPVLMTSECNLAEGFTAGAAMRIGTGAESITIGMNELFSLSQSDLKTMGWRGYELVKERFSWEKAANQMVKVYEWAIGGGPPPACVIGAKKLKCKKAKEPLI